MGVCSSSPGVGIAAPSRQTVRRIGYLDKRSTSADAIENVGNKKMANKWNERFFVLHDDAIMYVPSADNLEATPVDKNHLSAVDHFPPPNLQCSMKHVKITAGTTVGVVDKSAYGGLRNDKNYVLEISTSHGTGGGGPFRFLLCAEDDWTRRAWIAAITACAFAKRTSGSAIDHHRALAPADFNDFKADLNRDLPGCEGELARVAERLEHLAEGSSTPSSNAAPPKPPPASGAEEGASTKQSQPVVRRLSGFANASARFSELAIKFKDPNINLSLSSIWAHALPDSSNPKPFSPARAVELLHRYRNCPLRFTVFSDCLLRLALEDRDFRAHVDEFDTYLPQLLHLADIPHATRRLEDAIVAIASMSVKLALRIVWYLWGNHEDTMEHFAQLAMREGVVHPALRRNHDWPHYFARSERLLLRIRNVVRMYKARSAGAKDVALDISVVEENISEPLGDLAPFQAICDKFALIADPPTELQEHMDNEMFEAWVLAHTDSAGRAAIWGAGLIPSAVRDDGDGAIHMAWVTQHIGPSFDATAIDPARPLSKEDEAECKALELSTFADVPANDQQDATADETDSANQTATKHTAFGSQLRFWYNITNVAETLRERINEDTVGGVKNAKSVVKEKRKKLMPTLITPDKLAIEHIGTCFYPITSFDSAIEEVIRVSPIGCRVFSTNERCPVLLNFETCVSTERTEVQDATTADTSVAAASAAGGSGSDSADVNEGADVGNASKSRTTPTDAPAADSGDDAGAADDAAAEKQSSDGSAAASEVVTETGPVTQTGPVTRCRSHDIMGPPWSETVANIQSQSPLGHSKGWRLRSLLAKSNDDLRQEVFVMQLWTMMSTIMASMDSPLPLKCYQIITTGARTGLIETLTEATSLDGLIDSHGAHNLLDHFKVQYSYGGAAMEKRAVDNFVKSLAAQSVATYLLAVKDRHNGNVMISSDGSIFNIDFGFLLGITTGFFAGPKRLALEDFAPFKLTKQMVSLLDAHGKWDEFVEHICDGVDAISRHGDEMATLLDLMGHHSKFEFYVGHYEKDKPQTAEKVVKDFKARLFYGLPSKQRRQKVKALCKKAKGNFGTWAYDVFQEKSNGINM
jgi:phosphatidylinositol 4-kinase